MTSPISIRLRKLHPLAETPHYAHGPGEDAGMDLCSVESATIPPGEWTDVGTGLAVEIPPGYHGEVRPRSGLARRNGVTMLNSPGTIDPGYRGEIRVIMINHGPAPFKVEPGDRIAQLVIASYAAVEWEVAVDLAESVRGGGGFGSTGR
jgi:dUTP pyrophosphatase